MCWLNFTLRLKSKKHWSPTYTETPTHLLLSQELCLVHSGLGWVAKAWEEDEVGGS